MEFTGVIILGLNGLQFGMLLFLLAVGLSLMFGLMSVINLAHGFFFIVGGYVGVSTFRLTESFLLSLLAGAFVVGLLGLCSERFLLRRVHGRHPEQVLLTFGLVFVLTDVTLWIWGPTPLRIPAPAALDFVVTISGRAYPFYRLMIIVTGGLVAAVLGWVQEKTRWGAIVRAGVDDREMTEGLGINISLVLTLVFSVGAFLAGFAGVMAAPVLAVYHGLAHTVLILSLAAIVVGGMGSLRGCLLMSLLFGLADTFGKVLWPGFAIFTIYAMVAIVLIVKPSGLFGRGIR
ncbi:MAG: branched-chain amino acid ABC transporter permease [Deltaproteobacteria bacterium]